eukprot:SAG31_NODE_16224_length_717_cov_6.959547_1_plen_65_part_00
MRLTVPDAAWYSKFNSCVHTYGKFVRRRAITYMYPPYLVLNLNLDATAVANLVPRYPVPKLKLR